MIPKVIHYCWFGKKPKSELIEKCILSWKKYCPDWEIIEWNESNFNVEVVPFMKEAYENKKWAFVSDVARLQILYQWGGVYLDTDVELFASLDDLLINGAFYVFESNRNINTGLGFGAEKNHKSVKAMLKFYEGRHLVVDGQVKLIPCPAGNTETLKNTYSKFIRNGERQDFDDIRILSNQDYSKIAKHHGTATWFEGVRKNKVVKKYHDTKIKRFLRDYRCFEFLENHFGQSVVDVYTFLVYDFLEYGIIYYFKRLIDRFSNRG